MHILQNLFLKEKVFINKKSYDGYEVDLKITKYFKDKNNGFYVDVGAHHPTKINNTYLLYKRNWRGINIDISDFSIDLFNFWRPKDLNFYRAITNKNGIAKKYYQKDFSFLSTISKEQAKNNFQGKIKEKKIKCSTLTNLLENTKYKKRKIDFLNVDVEGHDLEVLKSLNFKIYRPKCICIEDVDVYYKKINIKKTKIHKFLKKLKYKLLLSNNFNHLYFHVGKNGGLDGGLDTTYTRGI